MGWTLLYLFLFLKLPIVGAGWIVWWAVHQQDEAPPTGDDGGTPHPPHPHHQRPRHPRPPRRGPHGGGALRSPERVRPLRGSVRRPRAPHH